MEEFVDSSDVLVLWKLPEPRVVQTHDPLLFSDRIPEPVAPDTQAVVEPTNNRAELALRELVVQRKIIGTLRNAKGTSSTKP